MQSGDPFCLLTMAHVAFAFCPSKCNGNSSSRFAGMPLPMEARLLCSCLLGALSCPSNLRLRDGMAEGGAGSDDLKHGPTKPGSRAERVWYPILNASPATSEFTPVVCLPKSVSPRTVLVVVFSLDVLDGSGPREEFSSRVVVWRSGSIPRIPTSSCGESRVPLRSWI